MDPTGAGPRVIADRYELGPRLGTGGMGEVLAATDRRLHRGVAVKLLREDLNFDAGAAFRFVAEARSAARLHHPNVVAVYDAGEDGAHHFMVMEALPGRTLADRMAEGPLSIAETRQVGSDVLAALGAAHDARLVHRDVKPGNVLEAADGTWKVADFGIAKSIEGPVSDLTATGLVLGTPAYLSPEQLTGHPATPTSDLWAAGVVLYEALAGAKPFTAPTPYAMADVVRTTQPPLLTDIRSDVPPTLAAAVHRALSVDPAGRWPDAAAMAAAVGGAGGIRGAAVAGAEADAPTEAITAAVPAAAAAGVVGAAAGAAASEPTAVMPQGPEEAEAPPPSPARRWAWLAAVIAVLFLAGAVILAFVLSDQSDPARDPGATDPAVATTVAPTTAVPSSTRAPTTTGPTTTAAPRSTTTTPTTTTEPSTTTSTTSTTSTTTTTTTTTAPKKADKAPNRLRG